MAIAGITSAPARTQTLPNVGPFNDGQSGLIAGTGANVTLGRSTLFGRLYLQTAGGKPIEMGGMQAFSVEETNDMQLRSMAGSDWQEPVFGARRWSGSFSRFQIRNNDFQEILSTAYGLGKGSDPDFRFLPFIWQYGFQYENVSGKLIENASWQWMTIFVTSYRTSFADPFSLIMEDGNFIGKGFARTDGSGQFDLRSPQYLWGAGSFIKGGGSSGEPASSPINSGSGALAAVGGAVGLAAGLGASANALGAVTGGNGNVTGSQQARDVRG